MENIEYRVRPVTRYVVTRYEAGKNEGGKFGGVVGMGEYDNSYIAYQVGYALCKAEHERIGWPVGDTRITYPQLVPEAPVEGSPLTAQ